MRHRVILFFIIIVTALAVRAQEATPVDTSGYRLRVPTAKEYLGVIPDAMNQWWDELPDHYDKIPSQSIIGAIASELTYRYSDAEIFNQSFSLLSATYESLTTRLAPNAAQMLRPDTWIPAILQAEFRDDPTTFLGADELPGDAQAVDFNGDGINEYWLGARFEHYSTFFVLRQDSSSPEGYRFVSTPLPLVESNALGGNPTDIASLFLDDINADGLPEWVVFASSYGNFQTCGTLYVLAWRNDALVNLLPDRQYSSICEPETPQLVNVDSDPALEIQQDHAGYDNWGCEWTERHIFDWDGSVYRHINGGIRYQDTLGCALRQAEPLMWDNDAAAAITLYEHGLDVGWHDDSILGGLDRQREMRQYAQARLALAYALAGRTDDASKLLAELKIEPPESEMMQTMIQALTQAAPQPLAFCTAAYNVFFDYSRAMFGYDLPSQIIVGRSDYVQGMGDNFPPPPENAGCNVAPLIDEALISAPFTNERSPVEQLSERGIEVEFSMHFDLNNDGSEEWLVWPVAQVDPVFFAPSGDSYHVSRPSVRRPNQVTQVTAHSLPDHSTAVATLIYLGVPYGLEFHRYHVLVGSCIDSVEARGRDEYTSSGDFTLWRMSGGELQDFLDMLLCKQRELPDFFSPDGRQLYGCAILVAGDGPFLHWYGPATYLWDDVQKVYVPPQAVYAEPSPPEFVPGYSNATLADGYLFQAFDYVNLAFFQGRMEDSLRILDAALQNRAPDASPVILSGLHYYRALALEALNRPDEALAEYVAIYQAAPDSAWGMLAALHLERA